MEGILQLYTMKRGPGLTALGAAGSIRFRDGREAAAGWQAPADGKELAP
jgi:hypothetical protein